jgi:acyl-CoA reductase-like NAD-dependent aldehyde dehydrogenase
MYKFRPPRGRDVPDAIAKGNNSPFGLAAGVWTRDIRKAHQGAALLEAGTVWVNCYNAFDNASPWGGFKMSGIGRENGLVAYDEYTQIRNVIVNLSDDAFDWYADDSGTKRYS